VVILGISNDAPAKNKAFKAKFDFPFDLLSDPANTTAVAYGAAEDTGAKSHKRISYIIDPAGRIQKVYGEVNAAEHPEQVLKDLGG
jgi:thioredoxin-dependent peroxiredoxin